MDDLNVWQGGRLDFQIVTDDEDAVSATMALRNSDDDVFEFTVPFEDLVADFQSEVGITVLPVGVYSYQVLENFATGLPNKFPDPDNCTGECELPTLTICEAIEVS